MVDRLREFKKRFPAPENTIVFSKERVAAFSDAVIAIAITLLVIDIHPNVESLHTNQDVWNEIRRLLPNIISFAISFWLISRFWITNQIFFKSIKKLDMKILQYNTLFLFIIALLPFPTALLSAAHLTRATIIIYALTMGIASIVQSLMWRQLLDADHRSEDTSKFSVTFRVLQYRISAGLFFASIGISYINLYLAIAFWCLFGFNRLFTELSSDSFENMEKWFIHSKDKKSSS